MASGNGPGGWRRFFGLTREQRREAIEALKDQYVDHAQQSERLRSYAARMQYPQFRERLLVIANEKTAFAQRLAEKLTAAGGALPPIPEVVPVEQNSWSQLMDALEQESRSADRLQLQLRTMASADPGAFALLEEIARAQKKHRDAIRQMLMRSDPFASSLS